MTTPEQVPSSLTAGDRWDWTRDLEDYPAGTWTLTYYFQSKEGNFSIAGSADGTTHVFSIAAATTATYKQGRYKYRGRASNGLAIITVEDGYADVELNPAATGLHDTRSFARRTLDAIEATLEGRATADQLAMSVGGRSLSRTPIGELLEWRDKMRAEVRTEEQGESAGAGRNIKMRFARP